MKRQKPVESAIDPELAVMSAMARLDVAAQARVIQYCFERLKAALRLTAAVEQIAYAQMRPPAPVAATPSVGEGQAEPDPNVVSSTLEDNETLPADEGGAAPADPAADDTDEDVPVELVDADKQ